MNTDFDGEFVGK